MRILSYTSCVKKRAKRETLDNAKNQSFQYSAVILT